MSDLPITCTLTPGDLKARQDDLLPGLLRGAIERVESPHGFRYRFDTAPGRLATLAEVVERERVCCRFFEFTIRMEPDAGPIWLSVEGPEGTKAFLGSLSERVSVKGVGVKGPRRSRAVARFTGGGGTKDEA